jgi:cobalamin biosynthesis protein CobT
MKGFSYRYLYLFIGTDTVLSFEDNYYYPVPEMIRAHNFMLACVKEIKDEPDSDGEGVTNHNTEIKQNKEEDNGEDGKEAKKEEAEKDEEEEARVFSENLSDMCLCECKLCGKSVYHHQIKSHNDNTHRPAKSQYDFIRQTYYRYRYIRFFD